MRMQRLAFGALSGISATMAMTAAMRKLFAHLPPQERYPLPPRELTERLLPVSPRNLPALTVLAHFAYGAAAGAVYGSLPRQRGLLWSGRLGGELSWLDPWSPPPQTRKPASPAARPSDDRGPPRLGYGHGRRNARIGPFGP